MHAELRGLYSPDVPEGLEAFSPEDAECFNLLVGAFIGPADNGGEDLFYFSVCTATWLAEHPPPKNFEFLRNTILMNRWDHSTLHRAITDLCRRAEGPDWDAVALHLSRYGLWELEDAFSASPSEGGRLRSFLRIKR
jgi:hypothetical protein